MRYQIGGLIFGGVIRGGAYFRNFTVFLNFICIFDHVFYELPRMLKSKNVNHDVTMNPPINTVELTKKLIKRKR